MLKSGKAVMRLSDILITSILCQRQPHDNGCPLTDFANVFNPPTMSFKDVLDNRYAETNTEILGTEHWFKNTIDYLLAHSRAVILNNYLANPVDKPGSDHDFFVRLVNLIECLQGIVDDIDHRPAQAFGIN